MPSRIWKLNGRDCDEHVMFYATQLPQLTCYWINYRKIKGMTNITYSPLDYDSESVSEVKRQECGHHDGINKCIATQI